MLTSNTQRPKDAIRLGHPMIHPMIMPALLEVCPIRKGHTSCPLTMTSLRSSKKSGQELVWFVRPRAAVICGLRRPRLGERKANKMEHGSVWTQHDTALQVIHVKGTTWSSYNKCINVHLLRTSLSTLTYPHHLSAPGTSSDTMQPLPNGSLEAIIHHARDLMHQEGCYIWGLATWKQLRSNRPKHQRRWSHRQTIGS